MKPLCVTAVVDEGYQEYIPLYLYFLFRAYPHYDAIVYFDGNLRPEVAECIALVRGLGSFDIRPLDYGFDRASAQNLMSLRWVIYDADYERYENVYTGDIDLFIVAETPGLRERHIEHCEVIELPYSNRVRGGFKKLSGLHFVRTASYYPRVRPIMERYRDLIATGTYRVHNEEMLYAMMEESVGLPRVRAGFPVHHGIHLRAFRDTPVSVAEQRNRTDYLFAKVFETYDRGFLAAARDPRCREILERLSRIDYGAIPRRYATAGPDLLRQFETVLALCRELEGEREAARA